MIALWNTIYMQAILEQLRAENYPVLDEDVAHLSPLTYDHINMLGRYSFAVPESVARGELGPYGTRLRTVLRPVFRSIAPRKAGIREF